MTKNKIKMNSFIGKQVLKVIREGKDYAHAGEEEAIDLVLNHLKHQKYEILDIGCGTGGTANYIYNKGWGNITGIDLDDSQIEYAKNKYPDISFKSLDVIDIHKYLKKHFNLILHFNSFYAFNNSDKALKSINKISSNDAKIVIFDYIDLKNYKNNPIEIDGEKILSDVFSLESIKDDLKNNNWNLTNLIKLDEEYIKWYKRLLKEMKNKRNEIVSISSEQFFDYVLIHYAKLLNALEEGRLGGICLYAEKVNCEQ